MRSKSLVLRSSCSRTALMWPGIVSQGNDKVFALKIAARRRLFGFCFAPDEFASDDYAVLYDRGVRDLYVVCQHGLIDLRLGADPHVVPENSIVDLRGSSQCAVRARDVCVPLLAQHLDADVAVTLQR